MTINLNPSISNNVSGFNQLQNQIEENSKQLSSGQRINNAAVDPAGLQVLIDFQSQILGNNTAIRNSLDGVSAIQIAEGGISQVTDSLQQIRELSIQAQNGILNDQDRATLQNQADALLEGIRDSLGQATFNGQSLLTEEGELQLQTSSGAEDNQQVGTFNVESGLEDLDLFSLDITSAESLDILDQSQDFINTISGEFGAAQNRLDSTINRLSESTLNEAEAASRIGDTDFAQTISERANALIQQEVGIAIQAQANASRGLVLNLLGT
jgi:flagellin